jgi:hypothetical protein
VPQFHHSLMHTRLHRGELAWKNEHYAEIDRLTPRNAAKVSSHIIVEYAKSIIGLLYAGFSCSDG